MFRPFFVSEHTEKEEILMAGIWKYTLSAAEMAKEEIEYGIFQQRSRCNADS